MAQYQKQDQGEHPKGHFAQRKGKPIGKRGEKNPQGGADCFVEPIGKGSAVHHGNIKDDAERGNAVQNDADQRQTLIFGVYGALGRLLVRWECGEFSGGNAGLRRPWGILGGNVVFLIHNVFFHKNCKGFVCVSVGVGDTDQLAMG